MRYRYSTYSSGGTMSFKIEVSSFIDTNKSYDEAEANKRFAQIIAADTEKFLPWKSGRLTNSTIVDEGSITYDVPYARYLYYGNVMKDRDTGKGPMHWVYYGEDVFRWHRGATLVETDRDINYDLSTHPDAQSVWFAASKYENLSKWRNDAANIVKQTKNGIVKTILSGFKKNKKW